MSQPLPHHYSATLRWDGDGAGQVSAGTRPVMAVGPPPEFGGDDRYWSPEHLLLSALNACLMTTFAAMARAQGLGVAGYESTAHADLDRGADGVGFTRFRIEVTVAGAPGEADRLRAVLTRAKARCFVGNALRLPVEVEVKVASGRAAPLQEPAPARP